MRSLLAVMILATSAYAGPSPVTIVNGTLWPSHPNPVSVRIGGGPWQKVGTKLSVDAPPIKVPTGGKAIAFDVQAPSGSKSFRRWAVVVPDRAYRVEGNPCGTWGLEVDSKGDDEAGESRIQVDASALSPKLFPLVISTDGDMDGEPTSDTILYEPGMSLSIQLPVSAMCARSGTSLVVYSRATKKRLFDESVIAHPGVLHTLRLAKGSFTITIAR